MIKINLATRKQATATSTADGKSGPHLSIDFDGAADLLKDRVVRNIVLAIIVGVGASWYADSAQQEMVDRAQASLDKILVERTKLKAEANKIEIYKKDKADVEAAQNLIRTKLEVMTKLNNERGAPPKILKMLSASIPAEVWLSEFKIYNNEVSVHGFASEYGQISDLIKTLQESTFFTDVTLKSSQTTKDDSGAQFASFDIGAKQRQ